MVGIWWRSSSFLSKVALAAALLMKTFLLFQVVSLHISGGAGKVSQTEIVADAIKRFRLAQEEVSMGQERIPEVLDHPLLRSEAEVDQHIAAEDHIETSHRGHRRVLGEIQTAEIDVGANRGANLQL